MHNAYLIFAFIVDALGKFGVELTENVFLMLQGCVWNIMNMDVHLYSIFTQLNSRIYI